MSPSENLTLQITAADIAAEIFVITGDFYLADRGVGKLVTKPLSPGIYKVKAKLNQQTWEQHVTLTQPGQQVTIPPFEFSSAAPLAGTAKTHEYQMGAAESESRKIHASVGQGSCICIFAREWGAEKRSGSPATTNPILGLSLRAATEQENELVNLETSAKVDTTVPDVWGACNTAVDPGIYVVRLTLPSGARYERTVVAAAGWQTQLFLLMRDYDTVRCADLARGSVLMVRGLGFNNADASLRYVEMARMALTNERKLLNSELLEILRGKFDNPMLGILGGHLLLLDQTPDLALLTEVVNNLRLLLNDQHPDVEALALKAGIGSKYLFTVPPMLRRSWTLIVNATVDRPELVPSDSLAGRSARTLWEVEPWLIWEMKDTAFEALGTVELATAFDTALQLHFAPAPPVAVRSASAFEAVRKLRETMPTAPRPLQPAISLDPAKLGRLVRTLGVPRSTLEGMVEQMKSENS